MTSLIWFWVASSMKESKISLMASGDTRSMERVQLCCLEGILNFVAIIVQLMPGDAKFGQGVGRISKGGMRVHVLEEVGEFGSLIKFSAGV